MILLTATTHTLEAVTSSTSAIDYLICYADITTTTFTPGSLQGAITTATTTTVCTAPAASTQRQVKFMSFANKGVANNIITIQKDVSATNYEMAPGITLGADEILLYVEGAGFTVLTASGALKTGSGVTNGDYGDITVSSSGTAWAIDSSAVTYAKIQNVSATDKLLGRSTAGAGVIEEITLTAAGRAIIDDADASAQRTTLGLGTLATQSGTFSGTSSGTNSGDQTISLTGDVTGSGTGSFAATIANDAVTLAKMANMATGSLIGRNTGGTGDPEVITDIPTSVTIGGAYVTRVGGTDVIVADGGTGRSTATAYAPVVGGTTTTGALQSTAVGSAGQVLQSAGASAVPAYSTPTYPSASGTSRKILVSDGTNNVYSTETYAVPGTSGNVLTSDGTNWTSAAPTGGGGGGQDAYTTTATAAGTTTLTSSSNYQQFFTGTTTQTVQMPVTSTLTLGYSWLIVNQSTGSVTINSSGSNLITVLPSNTSCVVTCILITGTTAASWSVNTNAHGQNTGFYAYQTGTLAITNSVYTKCQLNTESWDFASWFDSTTNYRYTPLVPGKYLFVGSIYVAGCSDGATVAGMIYKNGVAEAENLTVIGAAGGVILQVSNILNMNGSTDYVELYVYASAGTVTLYNTFTSMTGLKIG